MTQRERLKPCTRRSGNAASVEGDETQYRFAEHHERLVIAIAGGLAVVTTAY
jgi:hypothetical protein